MCRLQRTGLLPISRYGRKIEYDSLRRVAKGSGRRPDRGSSKRRRCKTIRLVHPRDRSHRRCRSRLRCSRLRLRRSERSAHRSSRKTRRPRSPKQERGATPTRKCTMQVSCRRRYPNKRGFGKTNRQVWSPPAPGRTCRPPCELVIEGIPWRFATAGHSDTATSLVPKLAKRR